jgi:hypothetical protein
VDGPPKAHQGLSQAIRPGRLRLAGEISFDGGVEGRCTTPTGQLGGRLDGAQPQGPLDDPEPSRRPRPEEQVDPLQDLGAAVLDQGRGRTGDADFEDARRPATG